jgi:hypothetical protein
MVAHTVRNAQDQWLQTATLHAEYRIETEHDFVSFSVFVFAGNIQRLLLPLPFRRRILTGFSSPVVDERQGG